MAWGHDFPPWHEVQHQWQQRCGCPPVPGNTAILFNLCHGTTSACRPNDTSDWVCRWCRGTTDVECQACRTGTHYQQGHCHWQRGDHTLFRLPVGSARHLCPDSACTLTSEMSNLTAHAPPIRGFAAESIDDLARMTTPGAGSLAAPTVTSQKANGTVDRILASRGSATIRDVTGRYLHCPGRHHSQHRGHARMFPSPPQASHGLVTLPFVPILRRELESAGG
jgi:hypothetical protein